MKRKQKWQIGNVFLVKLLDNNYCLGQIIGQETQALNSVTCAFFNQKISNLQESILPLEREQLFSTLFVTRDLLDNHKWPIVASQRILVEKNQYPNESFRALGWVGAKIIGSANVESFLNAYYGLEPWDDWANPNYLDTLLLSSEKKPKNIILKKK